MTTDTSLAAHANTKPRMTRDRQRILELLKDVPTLFWDGLTCDQIESVLGMLHATCSARLCDMRKEGLIEDTGLRRKTRTGSSAKVWRAVR